MRLRTTRAIAGQIAVNELRIDLGERLVVERELLGLARALVVHDDVGAAHQLMSNRACFRRFQVQHDVAFAALRRLERVGERPHLIAAGRFDLDHIRAEIREDLGPVGCCEEGREIQYPDALQSVLQPLG